MSKTKLFPCTDIPVTDPATGKPVSPDGISVELDAYWEERIKEGTMAPANPLKGDDPDPEDVKLEDMVFDSMKAGDLKDLAIGLEVEGAKGMNKGQLVEALEAYREAEQG